MKKRFAVVLALGLACISQPGCKRTGIASSDGVPTLQLIQQGGPGSLTQTAQTSSETDFTLDFSNVQVGQTRVLSLTLGNSNLSGYTLTKIQGPADPEFAMTGVSEGATITTGIPLQLQFKPFTAGAKTDQITLTTDAASGGTVVIHLTGTGVKLDITVVPPALDFGNVVVNTTSTLSVTVTNQSGTLPVSLAAFSVTGNDANLFDLEGTANGQAQELAPGASLSIAVDFKPLIPTATDSTAAFILHFCDGCVDTTVNMRGRGVASGLVISPIPLDFGFVPVLKTKLAAVTVSNVANQTVQILTATPQSSASGPPSRPMPPSPRPPSRSRRGNRRPIRSTSPRRRASSTPGSLEPHHHRFEPESAHSGSGLRRGSPDQLPTGGARLWDGGGGLAGDPDRLLHQRRHRRAGSDQRGPSPPPSCRFRPPGSASAGAPPSARTWISPPPASPPGRPRRSTWSTLQPRPAPTRARWPSPATTPSTRRPRSPCPGRPNRCPPAPSP